MAGLSKIFSATLAAAIIFFAGLVSGCDDGEKKSEVTQEFLNVSYDPTRELYNSEKN